MTTFEIIKNNNKRWNEIVKSFCDFDVYYLNEYVQSFCYVDKFEPFLIYFKGNKMELCYVIEKRDIADFKAFENRLSHNTFFDISTPYGYGGPLVKNCNQSDMEIFFNKLNDWAKNENIVSQFIRFHPLLENHKYFDQFCEEKTFKKTVYLLLDNEDLIYKNMDLTCRRHVKRAVKNNINVSIDNSKEAQKSFVDLYIQTMKRNDAQNYYYFNDNFFEQTFLDLGKNSNLFCAYYDKKIISSAIILQCNKQLHYHLVASDKEYMHLSPNKLLVYEIAKYGSQNFYKTLHLGGGNEPEDNLFAFKRSFNKNGLIDFFIGKNIFDKIKYNYLMNLRKEIDLNFNLETSYMIGYRV